MGWILRGIYIQTGGYALHTTHAHVHRSNPNIAHGSGCTLLPCSRRERRDVVRREKKLETKLEELVRRGGEREELEGKRGRGGPRQTEPVT